MRNDPVALEPMLYQRSTWCPNCGGLQTFVEVFEIESGRVGFCMGCGDEKFVAFTHATAEAA